jgi:hypothetical protein
MNYKRITLAALAGFLAYFLAGTLLFTLPGMKSEYGRFPAVYRSAAGIQKVFPLGMAAMLLAMFALAAMYAKGYERSSSVVEGLGFGALVGVFSVGAFVLHNYVNLNIGLKLTVFQAAAYFTEWVLVGMVIGAIYKPTKR